MIQNYVELHLAVFAGRLLGCISNGSGSCSLSKDGNLPIGHCKQEDDDDLWRSC